MSRTLTPARRRSLAAARARATEARHEREDRALTLWRDWLHREAISYSELVAARNMFGPNSQEANQAYKGWRKVKGNEPTRPPDTAFKRARGEDSEHDSK